MGQEDYQATALCYTERGLYKEVFVDRSMGVFTSCNLRHFCELPLSLE